VTFPRPFGRYTLLAALGKGGMGEVYGARVDIAGGFDKLCVVKTLPRDISHDRESRARFLDEARLVVKLNQRNICSVFDVGVVDGVHFLAMELVHGRDLRTVWKRALEHKTPIEQGLALFILAEVLDGLDYAHRLADPASGALHIVHRDVSAQNIMVSFEGDVKLIDFGLAASTLKLEKTETNVVLGKVAYMPPEQLRGEPLDARADVFAAGVVLYELIAGERYYEGTPPLMVSGAAASGTFLPAKLDAVDVELRPILLHALAPKRDDRTPTAAAFAEELRAHAARRGMRGDASQLRKLMSQLFGDNADPWQAGSASTSVSEVMAAAAGATLSSSRSRSVDATSEQTAQTERVEGRSLERLSRRRRVGAAVSIGAGLALAIAIAIAIGVIALPRRASPPVAAPSPTASALATAQTTASALATAQTPAATTTTATTTATPVALAGDSHVDAGSTTTTTTSAEPSTPTPGFSRATALKPRAPPRPAESADAMDKGAWMEAWCTRPCAQKLERAKDAQSIARYVHDVERCFPKCQ
jgi:serine/threonine-protein kinase